MKPLSAALAPTISATVTVIICTLNRHALLVQALQSVRAQEHPESVAVDILVVDNSPDANARFVVEQVGRGPGLPVRYVCEPEPNISRARNAGIALADSDFVAFLDDDEWCEAGWLASLLRTAADSGADVVFGAVLPEFPGGPPEWDPNGRTYERHMQLPEGAIIGIDHDERISGRWIGTGNSLLRRSTCQLEHNTFALELGKCGGEDYDLFVRLHGQGLRFAWSPSAVAHEIVPADRTSAAYMRQRSFRAGQQWGAITVGRSRAPWLTAVWIALKATIQLVLVALLWLGRRLLTPGRADRTSTKLAEIRGKLVWWRLNRSGR